MSELSDYKRIVSGPREKQLLDRIKILEAACQAVVNARTTWQTNNAKQQCAALAAK